MRSAYSDGSVVCKSSGASAIYQPALRPWVLDLASLGTNYSCYVGWYQGLVFRVNADAFTTAPSASIHVAAIDPNSMGFMGGFTDDRFVRLAPYLGNKSARIDLAVKLQYVVSVHSD